MRRPESFLDSLSRLMEGRRVKPRGALNELQQATCPRVASVSLVNYVTGQTRHALILCDHIADPSLIIDGHRNHGESFSLSFRSRNASVGCMDPLDRYQHARKRLGAGCHISNLDTLLIRRITGQSKSSTRRIEWRQVRKEEEVVEGKGQG